jgi:DNA-binding IclR family transcriptional regulator
VVGRALLVVEHVASAPFVSLAELTRRTGLPKPTVHRIARDLVRRGVLTRDRDGFGLGRALGDLADAAAAQRELAGVRPYLQDLSCALGGVVWLYLGSAHRPDARPCGVVRPAELRWTEARWPDPRSLATLANTARGHTVLARRPDLVELLARRGVPRLTPRSPADVRSVRAALHRAQDSGLFVELEQHTAGWTCVAMPVVVAGRHDGVLGVSLRGARSMRQPIAAVRRAGAELATA